MNILILLVHLQGVSLPVIMNDRRLLLKRDHQSTTTTNNARKTYTNTINTCNLSILRILLPAVISLKQFITTRTHFFHTDACRYSLPPITPYPLFPILFYFYLSVADLEITSHPSVLYTLLPQTAR